MSTSPDTSSMQFEKNSTALGRPPYSSPKVIDVFIEKITGQRICSHSFLDILCISESIFELSSTGSHGVINWSVTWSIVKGPPVERISCNIMMLFNIFVPPCNNFKLSRALGSWN